MDCGIGMKRPKSLQRNNSFLFLLFGLFLLGLTKGLKNDAYSHEEGGPKCACIVPADEGCPNFKDSLTTGASFDEASNAAGCRNGQDSFWNCLIKRVLRIGGGDESPKCTVKTPSTKDKDGGEFEYSKCDRISGYEVIKDKICQQTERKPYCGPRGYAHCKEIRVRKEVRDLSKEELADLVEAVSTLTGTVGSTGKSIYADFVELTKKGRHLGMINGTSAYLPWYRRCLWELENELRKIKPNVTIPYWDWSLDSQSPEKSVVFSTEFFGAAAPEGSCVYGDLIKGIECVKRVWKEDTVPSLPSPDVLRILTRLSTNFEDFSTRLETLQGMVQIAIGGFQNSPEGTKPLGDLSGINAANDPLFWLIVAFTDKLWASAYAKNRCIRIVDDVPLWHFGKNSKDNESIASLCYMYLPSSIYKKTLLSMGFCRCKNPCKHEESKPCPQVKVCKKVPEKSAEIFPLEDICGRSFVTSLTSTTTTSTKPTTSTVKTTECPCAKAAALDDEVTVTETETQTVPCPPTKPPCGPIKPPCLEVANAQDTDYSGQMSLKVRCCPQERTSSHLDTLCKCGKSGAFSLPKSTHELNVYYEEIAKRFRIRKLIVSAYSRSPTILLRLPRPLPCFFVSMNRLDTHAVHGIEAEIIKSVIVLNAAISAGRYIPYGVSINALRCTESDKMAKGLASNTCGSPCPMIDSNDLCFEASGSSLIDSTLKVCGVKLPSVFIFGVTLVAILLF